MYDPNGTRYDMMGGGGGWMVGFAVVTLVLLLIAVIGVAVSIYLHTSRTTSASRRSPGAVGSAPEPRDLLDARLARGEVTPEEYRTVRSLLTSTGD
ncbi:hypothetical protein BH09ACT12_BH09ACT12_13850 [soil metagenome]